MRRAVIILGVYMILALLVGLIGYVVVPSFVREVHTLSHDAPHYAAQLRGNTTFRNYDDRYHITAKLLRDTHRLPEILAKAAGPLKDVTVGAASLITQLITVLAVTFPARVARPRVHGARAVTDREASAALSAGCHRHQGRGGRRHAGQHRN